MSTEHRAQSTEHRAQSTEHRRFFLKRAFKFLIVGAPFFLRKPELKKPFQNLNIDELRKDSSFLIALNSAEAGHSCPKGQTPSHRGVLCGDNPMGRPDRLCMISSCS